MNTRYRHSLEPKLGLDVRLTGYVVIVVVVELSQPEYDEKFPCLRRNQLHLLSQIYVRYIVLGPPLCLFLSPI